MTAVTIENTEAVEKVHKKKLEVLSPTHGLIVSGVQPYLNYYLKNFKEVRHF